MDAYYLTKYRINFKTYVDLFLNQSGRCAICREKPEGRNLFVDHCHTTDKVRGLLCQTCNAGLGMFKDNLAYLARASVYLLDNPSDRLLERRKEVRDRSPQEVAKAKERNRIKKEYRQRLIDPNDCLGT